MKKRFILQWTMKRAGSHAIVEWIKGHIKPGPFCFFNQRQINCLVGPKRNHLISEDHEIFMFNLEDGKIVENKVVDQRIKDLGLSNQIEKRINIILLRDPFNIFASRMRGWSLKFAENSVKLWKEYAKEFLRETQKLDNVLPLNFNSWFSNEDYRKQLSIDLDLEFSDSGKNNLGYWGSSFDGKEYKSNANEMDVINRWRNYVDDENYINLFDEEIISLSKRIFNFCPEEIIKQIK